MGTYRAGAGRNFDEILRLIDRCCSPIAAGSQTLGDWKRREDVVILPAPQDADLVKQRLPVSSILAGP
jgi:alkyl hydroperoxide reductase subunit AhpC